MALPAGVLDAARLQALAELAHTHADGALHLTDHAGVRLSGDRAALTAGLAAHGLTAHGRRRRSILASPLSGRIGAHPEVHTHAAALHRRLPDTVPDTDTTVGFDDGTGDIAALTPDVAVLARPDGRWMLLRAGHDTGRLLETGDLVDVLLAVLPTLTSHPDGTPPAELPAPPAPPIGWLDQRDGAVTLAGGLRDGVLPARTAEFFAAVDRPVVITPWRSVLLCDLDEWMAEQVVRVLAPMGVIFDAQSPHLH